MFYAIRKTCVLVKTQSALDVLIAYLAEIVMVFESPTPIHHACNPSPVQIRGFPIRAVLLVNDGLTT